MPKRSARGTTFTYSAIAPSQTPLLSYSIVIPAFNEEALLPECLASFAQQDFAGKVEIIVVDNNSTDRTAPIAAEHGARVVFEPVPGVCAARQAGTVYATGDIVISADADTTYPVTWLSTIDRAFRADPAIVAVAGPAHWMQAPRWGRMYERLLFGLISLVFQLTGQVYYISAANIAFRRSAWSGYDTALTQGGDELDLLRNLRRAGQVIFLRDNPALTSPRRMNRGLFYNLFVTAFYYYLLGYALNRLMGRQVLGMAPSFRENYKVKRTPLRRSSHNAVKILMITLGVSATMFALLAVL